MPDKPSDGGRRDVSVDKLLEGIRCGDRATLARAITLVESRRREDMEAAQRLLLALLPNIGEAFRIGISGAPGVGKSTFIDALGVHLLDRGHRVAVLAVDPSSTLSGGSILGDKSRMPRLAALPRAFIRPSPNALTPGGVGRRTRETLLLCEAAGFDVVLVETVGVGQSETLVAEIVDSFIVLLLAGAGDELQGIKKGILELADLLAVNKADGDNRDRALVAMRDYQAALGYLRPRSAAWQPPVVTVSGRTGDGLEELWSHVERHRQTMAATGDLDRRRREQSRGWMWSLIEERLLDSFRQLPEVQARLPELERAVVEGRTTPTHAARTLLELFERRADSGDRDSD